MINPHPNHAHWRTIPHTGTSHVFIGQDSWSLCGLAQYDGYTGIKNSRPCRRCVSIARSKAQELFRREGRLPTIEEWHTVINEAEQKQCDVFE